MIMKNPDKIVIGIADQGVFPHWLEGSSSKSELFKEYYGDFEMEYYDCVDNGDSSCRNKVRGSHGYWVLDRLLQVCGDAKKIKIINCKIFSAKEGKPDGLHNALDIMIENDVDLLNLSIGVPRHVRFDKEYIEKFNCSLNTIMDNDGFTIISAGNEGELLSNGEILDNTNILADDPDNNLSVASHDESGQWDNFSCAGGTVDVSVTGSNLFLLGMDSIDRVSGTSFSCPTFCGICANYLIDQFTSLRKNKSVKEIIYEHLDEAIRPLYGGNNVLKRLLLNIPLKLAYEKSPWFGYGSFESYAKYFIRHYKRDMLRRELFEKEYSVRIM